MSNKTKKALREHLFYKQNKRCLMCNVRMFLPVYNRLEPTPDNEATLYCIIGKLNIFRGKVDNIKVVICRKCNEEVSKAEHLQVSLNLRRKLSGITDKNDAEISKNSQKRHSK